MKGEVSEHAIAAGTSPFFIRELEELIGPGKILWLVKRYGCRAELIQIKAFEPGNKGCWFYPQQGRSSPVAVYKPVCALQRGFQIGFFHVPHLLFRQNLLRAAIRLAAGFFRPILWSAKGKIGQGLLWSPGDDHSLNKILQFPDVARPIIAPQPEHLFFRQVKGSSGFCRPMKCNLSYIFNKLPGHFFHFQAIRIHWNPYPLLVDMLVVF